MSSAPGSSATPSARQTGQNDQLSISRSPPGSLGQMGPLCPREQPMVQWQGQSLILGRTAMGALSVAGQPLSALKTEVLLRVW
jgi:hypothetical protein